MRVRFQSTPWYLLLILVMIVSTGTDAYAGSASTFDFLRTDIGARAGALGGSVLSLTDDANLVFYNPAGLSTMTRRRISVGYFKHLLDINSANVAVAGEIEGLGTVGAGILYVNYGELKRTGSAGEDLGTFGAGEFSANVAYGGILTEGLRYGTAVKFIYSSIGEYSSSAVAVDLGAQYTVVPERFVVAAVLSHLGTQFDPYSTFREGLPLDLRVGVALTPEHLPATFLVDFHRLSDRRENFTSHFRAFSVGVEFTLSPNVFVRAGYNNERRQDLKIGSGTNTGLAGLSLGTGISTGEYQFDYAFSSNGPVGAFHRFTISF